MYIKKGYYKKAADDLKRATALDPSDEDHWYYLAVSLHHTHDCDIVDAMSRYVKLCKTRDCSSKRVAWAENTPGRLKARGICP